ncbi:MAG TPA: hypothetical protein EYQ25_00840 [Planctomycetes bacterium]|nr:hypothetical protein [Planctomycetota bacterium]HIL37856.1 hypothetical protein [Planctomycetota bacterium]
MNVHPTLVAASLIVGLSCASAPVMLLESSPGSVPAGALFPPAKTPLTLAAGPSEDGEEEQRASLLSLVEAYGAVTDQHVLLTESVRHQLSGTVCALQAGTVLPSHAVQSLTEHMLSSNGFFIRILRNEKPFTVEVVNSRGLFDLSGAFAIDPEAILSDPDHSALIVSTTYTLKSGDSREISQMMRSVSKGETSRMVPLSQNTINLIGPMPTVAAWLRTLLAMEQGAASSVQEVGTPVKMVRARFPLAHASSDEAENHVKRLFSNAQVKGRQSFVVVADERTNALLVYCSTEVLSAVEEAMALIDIGV